MMSECTACRLAVGLGAVACLVGCGKDRRSKTVDKMPDCENDHVYFYWYQEVDGLENHGSREAAEKAGKEDGCTKLLPKQPMGQNNVAACCPAKD